MEMLATRFSIAITGIAATLCAVSSAAATEEVDWISIATDDVHYRPINLGTEIRAIGSLSSDSSHNDKTRALPDRQLETQRRVRALQDLFAWVEEQPPVPHLSLDAMDRDEIY